MEANNKMYIKKNERKRFSSAMFNPTREGQVARVSWWHELLLSL